MPTSAANTYAMNRVDPFANPEDAMASITLEKLAASTTFAAGTIMGKITATGLYKAYASGNADGSQIPVGILQYAATTDASSNITNWTEWGVNPIVAPIYHGGEFLIADLVGLDDNAVTKLGARLDGAAVASATRIWIG
jgi:hypothetical protein